MKPKHTTPKPWRGRRERRLITKHIVRCDWTEARWRRHFQIRKASQQRAIANRPYLSGNLDDLIARAEARHREPATR